MKKKTKIKKQKLRKHQKAQTKTKRQQHQEDRILQKKCPLVHLFIQKYKIRPKKSPLEIFKISPPTNFSIIENPEESIKTIKRIIQAIASPITKEIHIDQSDCNNIDYCAETLLDIIILEAKKLKRLNFSGKYPTLPEMKERVLNTGLPDVLNITANNECSDRFIKFGIRKGNKPTLELAHESSQREKITTELTDYINDCLRQYGYEFNNLGLEHVASLVGEVIGNAEDHSGRNEWWVSAYMNAGSNKGNCHIVIVSIGKTIYQTITTLSPKSLLRRDISRLIKLHSQSGQFQKLKHSQTCWNGQSLWTLYALQEASSRHNQEIEQIADRGQGTADMIEYFQQIGASHGDSKESKMCLYSGGTHILFTQKYRIKIQKSNQNENRRIIAFNDKNSLDVRPDPNYVRTLRHDFPGVILSLNFYIDPQNIQEITGV